MARRTKQRRGQSGFTLIELLVVVIIIGILAAIALPNFIGAQDKAREASVKGNMRTAQIAAEMYATDQAGSYSLTIDGFKPYYPGGTSTPGGTDGKAPPNPFTNSAEWPTIGSITDVQATRAAAPTTVGAMGTVEYSAVGAGGSAAGAPSYAIRGAAKDGKALVGTAPGTTLVLSNQ